MRVVITGGAGFLGRRLAQALLARETLTDARGETRTIDRIVLADVVAPPQLSDSRVQAMQGTLDDTAFVERVVDARTDTVFHLAAVVSGQAEAEFDVGMRVNLDATRALLERCRACTKPPKFVFASSLAVFGGALPDPVPDDARVTPQSSYGAQKAICELLVNDMSRKGFIDGRALRLPTIVVRPGKPNRAASSFASGIIREPLSGIDAICPVAPATRLWLQSPRAVVANFIVGHEVSADELPAFRAINVPGIDVTVAEMVAALRSVAGNAVADRVQWQYDPVIDRIVATWPARFEARIGRALGMQADAGFEDVVRAYIEHDMPR